MRRFAAVLTCLLLASCGRGTRLAPAGGETETPRADIAAAVDAIAARAIREVPLDALSIVVLQGDGTVVEHAYGSAAGKPDTTYRIGSISKTITGIAILQLVEDGRVSLDDPLGRWFPSSLPAPDVTLAQLLAHTSGLPTHEPAAVAQWRERSVPITDEFVWQHLRTEPRLMRPGAGWSYGSSNFHLLGLVVAKAAGRDYEAHVRDAVAKPLGLGSLTLCSGREPTATQARDYVAADGALTPDANWTLPGIGGAGGWCASAGDVARLVHRVARGALLEPATLARMTSPTIIDGIEIGYGLGVRLGTTDGHAFWGHTGGGAVGNRTAVAHYPAHDLTIAVLANTEREDTPLSAMDIMSLVAREVLRLPAATVESRPLPPDAARYEGIYESPGRQTRVALVDGQLQVSRVGDDTPPEAMRYQRGHEFLPYADSPDYRFVFQVDEGHARAISAYDAGWFAGVRTRVGRSRASL